MKKKHRKLVVDGREYAWAGDWVHVNGRRVVRIRAWFKTEDDRKAGPKLAVNLVGRGGGMVDTSAARPRDARDAIVFAQTQGWTPEGRGTFWLRPAMGFALEGFDVIEPDAPS
ncbi:hypothetical protein [Myxococcus hansupus]|nr:hypothetical protein [Myxococcus hansupus]